MVLKWGLAGEWWVERACKELPTLHHCSGHKTMLPPADHTMPPNTPCLLLYAAAEALFCCDLQVTNPAITNWTAQLDGQGKDCSVESDEDHTDHDGHDHSAMNATGVNATGVNATGSAAARNSAAAAGASMAVLLGSLALAAFL
jgi:hypothetical protein